MKNTFFIKNSINSLLDLFLFILGVFMYENTFIPGFAENYSPIKLL